MKGHYKSWKEARDALVEFFGEGAHSNETDMITFPGGRVDLKYRERRTHRTHGVVRRFWASCYAPHPTPFGPERETVEEMLKDLNLTWEEEDGSVCYAGPPVSFERDPQEMRRKLEDLGWEYQTTYYTQGRASIRFDADPNLLPILSLPEMRGDDVTVNGSALQIPGPNTGRSYLAELRRAIDLYELTCRTCWGVTPGDMT